MTRTTMLLTIDVEDWFHLGGGKSDHLFKTPLHSAAPGSGYERRVEANVKWILDTLAMSEMKATFFVLSCVAEEHPKLIQEIARRGHRVASHSHRHSFITQQRPEEFRSDLRRSIRTLEDLTGRKVLGYRAPYFSMTEWALDIVAEEGLLYDSSFYPATYHDLYAKIPALENTRPIERLPNGLWEVRLSSVFLGRYAIPWGGGGYFRLMPYTLFRWGLRHILRHQGVYQFYIHPWELDPGTPRLEGLKTSSRLRRYTGLRSTRRRFEKLLREFQFLPIEDALESWGDRDPRPNVVNRGSVITSLV